MKIGSANTCMDPWIPCKFQCFGSHFNVFFYGAAKTTDLGLFNDRSDLFYTFKISGTGDRESGFNYINTQLFKLKCQLDLFFCIQLTAGNLFAVPESSIKN